MTALPQSQLRDARRAGPTHRSSSIRTASIFILTAGVSVLLAVIFGENIWRVVVGGVLVGILLVSLALVVIGTASLFRDDS